MILSTPTQHTSNIAVQISQLGHYDINSVREKKSNISQYFRSSTEGLVCVLVIQVWLKELCWWSVISCCGWPVCEKRLPELSWLSWADALLIIVIILNQSHSASDHREGRQSYQSIYIKIHCHLSNYFWFRTFLHSSSSPPASWCTLWTESERWAWQCQEVYKCNRWCKTKCLCWNFFATCVMCILEVCTGRSCDS